MPTRKRNDNDPVEVPSDPDQPGEFDPDTNAPKAPDREDQPEAQ